ncbi:MAG: hypothetical protein GEV10_10605 [Streptosporangiales bacterium]|nr:hypothetical protein [Streptosporangiales bacterium]
MANCPRCGIFAPPDDRFCQECGTPLEASSPSFDDLEEQRHGPAGHETGTQPFSPVQFSGPPVPAIDDTGQPMSPYPVERPTDETWGDEPTREWYPGYQQADHQTTQYQQADYQQTEYQQAQFPPPQYPPPDYPPPGGYDQPRRESRGGRRQGVLIAALAVLAVIAIASVSMLVVDARGDDSAEPVASSNAPSPKVSESSPEPTDAQSLPVSSAESQAKAVDVLLTRAAAGKSMLTTTYDSALACKISPASAERKFEAAAENRRGIVASGRKLDTSQLENGEQIKSLIISMYGTSARADDAFAAWAGAGDAKNVKCLKGNKLRTKGNDLSIQAGKTKQRFVKVWNPVAGSYGYTKRTKASL